MKVLHDWDRVWISGEWALRRIVSLFCYLLSKKIPVLRRVKYFHENTERIQAELMAYMETLIQLGRLTGVSPIFGIRDDVREKYGAEINELVLKYGVDVRRHTHIGELPDPDRIRTWDPPLNQSRDTWHFDRSWARGEKVILKPGELAVFHVDRPHYLADYIRYLFQEIVDDG